MPDTALRIEDGSGTVRDELDAESIAWTRAFDEQASGEAVVLRKYWTDVEDAIDARNDEFYLVGDGVDEFAGRFDDVETDGSRVTVRLTSPEQDAMDAEPTANNLTYQNEADSTIVTDDVVGGVSALSAGTINTVDASVSYSASFASRSKILYDLRPMTGAEFRYNADWTLDYVASLGSDKSGSVTLSPSNQNIVGDSFRKLQDVREDTTHVKGLGGQDGPTQVTASATVSHYSGGRPVWRRYTNKEIIDQSRLQAIVDNLASEIEDEPRYLEVECTVEGEDLELGDTVHVEYPEENIDTDLRVVMLTTELTRRGYLLLCTLSNRALSRSDRSAKRNDDLERFNHGYGGFVDRDNARAVERQPVGDGLKATGEYLYPDDVVGEERAEIVVKGLPYRAYSSGAANNPDFQNTVISSQAGGKYDLDIANYTTIDSITPSNDTSIMFVKATVKNDESDLVNLNARYYDATDNITLPSGAYVLTPIDTGATQTIWFADARNVNGHDLRLQLEARVGSQDDDGDGFSEVSADVQWQGVGLHNHDPDPGVVESFPDEPASNANDKLLASGVDLDIGGTTVATDIGSGEFSTTVDVTGEFSPGENDIELTADSNSLGFATAIVRTELFRRGETS
jgi:hypothetical protein